ncbi:MAG TPA: SPOR domain-containing protein [Rheinheimera sp.]|uniref:SPOR domain-containing protein n=1 Tax=Rheinheimera sp. TaxID=1869214 RepID=UPI002B48A155|nr:SPOR domain-containing protein [Rheinheimera sp.]HJS16693.1 SPOR domain-containing protein [Rheinheimera sp.]
MSKQALQQRLTQYSGLLASQRQLLQRLLLQLEFNQPDRLQLVGSSGSGKSTLILTLAEICSEQFNVALLQADAGLAPVDVLKVLQQQWIGSAAMPRTLTEFVAQLSKTEQYLLLVDDADQLNEASWQLIQQLPVSVFISSLKAKSDIRLAMNIPAFSEDEAAELLAPYNLAGREQRERIEDCAGDLHLLLHGLSVSPPRKAAVIAKPKAETSASPLAFSAREEVEAPAFVASAADSSFDLNSRDNPLGLRAIDTTDEQPSFSIETERRSDYRPGAVEQTKPAKQASGQFFSPFLVLSLGFGLIAAVVMFWLWTEQQFRQPIADDMVPYYPSSTDTSAAERLQKDRQFEPTVEIKQELPAEAASGAVTQTAAKTNEAKPDAADQGMPQMALEKNTDTASMTVQQEVAKDVNGLPQKQIVSMTIESEPMREQPVIPALPAAGEEVAATDPEPVAETPVKPAAVETAPEQNDLVAEMEADAAEAVPETLPEVAPTATNSAATDASAGHDAATLLGMLPDTVAIQLGVFSQEAAAKKFLQQYSSLNLQLYKRQQQGKTQFVVVSASYVNGGAARQQVKSLPEELRQQTPFVKPLSDIQREIRSANAN